MRITNNPNRNLECTRPVLFLIFLEGALKRNDLFRSRCRSPLKPRPNVSRSCHLSDRTHLNTYHMLSIEAQNLGFCWFTRYTFCGIGIDHSAVPCCGASTVLYNYFNGKRSTNSEP
jgi:hypothetical protein